MVTTPTNLDLCCPDAQAKPADLQRSSTFISCIGAVWVGLEFFRSLLANSEERSDFDISTDVSCPEVVHAGLDNPPTSCELVPKRWMSPIGMIEQQVGFVFTGIQNSSGGTIGTLPEKRTRLMATVLPIPAKILVLAR